MKFLNLAKGDVVVGCGHLYAMPVKDFKVGETTYATMKDIGYIHEEAVFRRSAESFDLETVSDGIIASIPGAYTTEFETGVISLTVDNMTLYTSGSATETLENGKVRIYGCESDKPAELALCFVGTDEDTGKTFELYMSYAIWQPNTEWTFADAETPISLNFHYKCCNTTLPNGKQGSYYIETNVGVESAT